MECGGCRVWSKAVITTKKSQKEAMDTPQEPDIFSEPITKKQTSKGFLLNDLWKEYKDEFLNWYLNKKYKGKTLEQLEKNQRKTVKAYISALDKLFSKFKIKNNLDIMEALKTLNYGKWYVNGLRNFLNFLFEVGLINMENYERMKKAIQSKKAEAPSEQVFEKININEIKKAYKRAIEYVKTKSRIPNRHDIKFEDNIAYILTHKAKRGKKGTYIAIMPKHFGEELTENIRYVGNLPERMALKKDIAEFIQGRSSVDVGSTHYLDKIRLAKEQYKKIADKFPKLD